MTTSSSVAAEIVGLFARTVVVNLPERTDRRRETERALAAAGAGPVEFFPAVRPLEAAGFPAVGARGCFLSHLSVLRQAARDRLPNLLVMEDDLEFAPALGARPGAVAAALAARPWAMAYFGHNLPDDASGGVLAPHSGPVMTTHFYGVNGHCLGPLADFLEAVLDRPPGHPDGGPMHVDGAFSTFRSQRPDLLTLVARPTLGRQRSSRSDVSPHWLERRAYLRWVAGGIRAVRRLARG